MNTGEMAKCEDLTRAELCRLDNWLRGSPKLQLLLIGQYLSKEVQGRTGGEPETESWAANWCMQGAKAGPCGLIQQWATEAQILNDKQDRPRTWWRGYISRMDGCVTVWRRPVRVPILTTVYHWKSQHNDHVRTRPQHNGRGCPGLLNHVVF